MALIVTLAVGGPVRLVSAGATAPAPAAPALAAPPGSAAVAAPALAASPGSAAVAAPVTPRSIPDAAALERIRILIARHPPARLSGTFGRIDCLAASADEQGFHFRDPFRRGVKRADLPTSPLAWSEIDRIEAARTRVGRGAVIGFLAGLAAGALGNSVSPPEGDSGFLHWGPTAGGVAAGRFALAVGVGTAVGAGIGYAVRTWSEVHPSVVSRE